jgi:hypothetical protein
MKKSLAFSALPLVAVFLLALPACSDKSGTDEAKVIQATDQSGSERAQKTEKDQAKAVSSSIKGGQKLKMDQFTLVIPGDWEKNQHLDVWCPATEADSRIPPDHYLTQGARPPMMLNSSDLIEGIKTSIGADPQDIKLIKIGSMNGATCGWEKGKYQSIGLFLQEKITGFDIPMLNFFILRAPKETFSQYEKTYWAILKSVSI